MGCPSTLTLDELLAGDRVGTAEEARLRDHLHGCAACQARSAALAASPVLVPDPAPAPNRVGTTARRFVGGGAATVAAAAAVLILWAHGPSRSLDGGDTRTKGTAALTVYVKHMGATGPVAEIERVDGEGALRPGDEMRFAVTLSHEGHAVVLGLDAKPSVTIYVPAEGHEPRSVRVPASGAVTLPGGVVADDTKGVERIVAVVCAEEVAPETLRRLAQVALARASGHPEAVSSLDSGCLEAFALLHKIP